ncbi:MAG: type I DNA topoisomerase [Bifidobacterium aquikefiri]|mgnify:CR=1 FL=1|uniref:DNA topoisomerase 1 n=1 Tax=Bifidobacterium aquikefiri TaxID=1653207 RepID=A0A261G3R4_9BIFI|nr:type I DNA topoisomerase [Bifidobacterium aquikefiri]OZG66071.1 DNA topoisomerase I [Bifidobacterium aquikefiri]
MATGRKLVIVESPTKAKKIGGYLGDGYTVMASVGHIRDLAQPSQVPSAQKSHFGKFGVDVDDGFKPYYIVDGNKKKTVAELKSALKSADELYLATDEDREGEAIAWHLVQTLKPKVPVKRMVFHEITRDAIRASLNKTRNVDDNMVDAQETRRVLDRLYGYELSPVLWRKVGPGLSAGRVQSVATRLIVERERERMNFVRTAYWDIVATLIAADSQETSFPARLVELGNRRVAGSKDFDDQGKPTPACQKDNALLVDEALANRLAEELKPADFIVTGLDTKPYRRRPQPPFTTSTLQQTAGNRLSMSSRSTMRAAQGLYENGYITYMRTDSVTLSQEAIEAARDDVRERYGKEYLSERPKQYTTKTAGAQEAHECIRPAGAHFKSPDELASLVPPDQLKLYTLIWRRTLASQMADATGSTATVHMQAETHSQGKAHFQASGTVIDFLGFMKALGEATGSRAHAGKTHESPEGDRHHEESSNVALPQLDRGDVLKAKDVSSDGHETQPPARYTEATLVKTLEAREIGRPSTYASIISTIIDRGYVYERGRALIPSWLAFSVIRLLESNFPQYVDYHFTAQMENGLDMIAHGKEKGKDWLTDFYFGAGEHSAKTTSQIHEGLQKQVAQLGDIDARAINTIAIGDGLQVRVGRYGPYLEDTVNTDEEGNPKRASLPETVAPDELTIEKGHELIATNSGGPRELGEDPETHGKVEVRKGRFGPYVALTLPEAVETEQTSGSTRKTSAKAASKTASKSTRSKSTKKAAASKPKMASLFKTMDPETISLDDALRLLRLPRTVGEIEEADDKTGEIHQSTIMASNGRYGPYLTKSLPDGKSDTRSLGSEDEIFTVDLDKAKELFAQPKYGNRRRGAAKPPLRELGPDPDNGKAVTIKDGFYGAYITDGETNRTLPKQYTPESIEPAQAFALLAEKRAAGPSKRRSSKAKGTRRKAPARKTTATASAAKKTTARKTATRRTSTASKSAATTARTSGRARKSSAEGQVKEA